MRLSGRAKIAYGMGAIGKNMVYALVTGFLFYYYNDILGIQPIFIGLIFMLARIFDAFNDPLMGVVVEKTRTRIGKFRPWILIGTIINAVVLFAMFAIPEDVVGSSLLIYSTVVYFIWGITYTIMDIPYWAMIPSITNPGKDRESLTVVGRGFAGVGFAIPTAITMLVVPLLGRGSEREGFRWLSLIIAIIFILSTLITVVVIKEKKNIDSKKISVKQMFLALIKNDQALVVVVSIVILNASIYLTQQMAIYFFKYDVGNAAYYGVFGTVGGISLIISMLFLPLFRKKYSCKDILKGAIVTVLIGYLLLFILGTFKIDSLLFLSLAAVIIFIGFGLTTVLTTIFLADSVDYGEWKMGSRNEGIIFSLQTLVVKVASAISVVVAGIGLHLIKLDQTLEMQTDSTLFGMRIIMIVIPMIGMIISLIFFSRKYNLCDEKLAEIVCDLEKRRGKICCEDSQ